MEAFLLSTGVIFLAELGDKSQLMALTFATEFRARTVLLGITIATAWSTSPRYCSAKPSGTHFPPARSQWSPGSRSSDSPRGLCAATH
jgi:putative Ca2+/H+ antiporter (TMEM165/GDT1 family)